MTRPDGEALRGRRVTVMGLGLQGGGVEVVRFLARRGASITVTDQRPAAALAESLAAIEGVEARLVLGRHEARDFETAEVVVANPAVSPAHPLLAAARAAGAEVTSEMALFLAACPARIALITGTQGKSSTTNAAARLLEECGLTVHLGGNIGRALIAAVDDMRAGDVAVVEISSYQLEALPAGFGPCARVAAVACVNVLADHLERHGSVEAYEAAKRRILELAPADAAVILSADDPRVSRWSAVRGRELRFGERAGGQGLRLDEGWFRLGTERLGRVDELRLAGAFQRTNVLAALGIARTLGAAPERLAAAIGKITGLEHRLQDLGRFAGRRVWDNAVSTTPDSTLSAVVALDRPLALLVGGQAKAALPLDELVEAARARVRRVIAFGSSADRLAEAFRRSGVEALATATVDDAVRAAFERMQPDEELLFSPACASFDAYRNFRDRALAFRRALPAADAPVASGA